MDRNRVAESIGLPWWDRPEYSQLSQGYEELGKKLWKFYEKVREA
jgi:hypothetical protein